MNSHSNKTAFEGKFSESLEFLSAEQMRAYNLHLLGWMNQEIADELHMQIEQVSMLLYQARAKVKEFLNGHGYDTKVANQEIMTLQKQDIDLLSKMLISKDSGICKENAVGQQAEHTKEIALLGQIKDSCIKASQSGKNILHIAELLGSVLSEEYREELFEQLEEYEAAQEGLENSSPADIDFDTLWQKALAKSKPMQIKLEIAKSIYVTLIASHIFSRLPIKHGLKGAPAENRLANENKDFRWEIIQDKTKLMLSLVAKSKKFIGKYVVISIPSANKVEYPARLIRWKQEGPENIGSEKPINSSGWVEIVVAETRLNMSNEEDFHLLENIFSEINLRLFEEKITK